MKLPKSLKRFKSKEINQFNKKFKKSWNKHSKIYIILAIAIVGTLALSISRAAPFTANFEPEAGTKGGCATSVSESGLSNGSAIKFCTPTPPSSGKVAGAQLPINYDLSTLTGTIKYIAPNGSDSNSGSVTSPYLTISKALSTLGTNGTIVVRGGTYRDQRNISIGSGKSGLRIIAYPGEIPVFNGAQAVSSSSGWTTEGSLKYRTYTPRPVTAGGGVTFSDTSKNTNLNGDGVGRYPDQAFIGNTALKQVLSKSSVTDGKFFADSTNKRIYMTATDSAKQNIEISRSSTGSSDMDRLFYIQTSDVKIEGIKITRYSASAIDYGAITVGGNNSQIKNVEITHMPYEAIHYAAGVANSLAQNITINNVGWQSINTDQTDGFTLDYAKITDADPFDEFSSSPASGALKTSRNRNTTVTNGVFDNNKSHALWFDQSNINTVVANNSLQNNSGAAIFFEISDGLLMVNNYVKSSGGAQPAKLAGSSGLILVNNTLIGGVDPIGIYTDPRSIPGCSTRPTTNPCQIASDLQKRYPVPSTMDWMPRLDMMLNNIVAYPQGATYCGGTEPLCIMTSHSSGASAPIQTIIHKADSSRNIPQSVINGNVYANGSGNLIRVSNPAASYTTLSAWTSAMAGSPVGINGIDSAGKYGNSWVNSDGSPTSALAAKHNEATAIPTNAALNKYIPAGTRHYGVLNK